MSSVSPSIHDGRITWNPRPPAGPPSAWIETTASACARLPIRARRLMHGPTPRLVRRVSTTSAPARRRMRAAERATFKVKRASV
jgi:hypothetical protein